MSTRIFIDNVPQDLTEPQVRHALNLKKGDAILVSPLSRAIVQPLNFRVESVVRKYISTDNYEFHIQTTAYDSGTRSARTGSSDSKNVDTFLFLSTGEEHSVVNPDVQHLLLTINLGEPFMFKGRYYSFDGKMILAAGQTTHWSVSAIRLRTEA